MTEGIAVFEDGTRQPFSLSYEEFVRMFRTAKLDNKPVREIEVSAKHSDKGPNRIRFV
jgi:hypothetical protein